MTTISNVNQMMGASGESYSVNGNIYVAAASGLITGGTNPSTGAFTGIQAGDVLGLLNSGVRFSAPRVEWVGPFVPLAASGTRTVANVAATNTTLTIAAQPDVPRPIIAVLAPGTLAITAGTLTMTYTAASGAAVTDTFSLVTPLSTSLTLTSSQGVAHLTSAVIAGITGGSSPTIQLGTTAAISLPISNVFAGLTVFKENVDNADEAVGTVTTTGSAGANNLAVSVAPTTAPNGTHSYTFGVSYSP